VEVPLLDTVQMGFETRFRELVAILLYTSSIRVVLHGESPPPNLAPEGLEKK
jgi:hypothetical protein